LFDAAVARNGLPPRRDLAQRAALDNLSLVGARIGRYEEVATLYSASYPTPRPSGTAQWHIRAVTLSRVAGRGDGQSETAVDHFAAPPRSTNALAPHF